MAKFVDFDQKGWMVTQKSISKSTEETLQQKNAGKNWRTSVEIQHRTQLKTLVYLTAVPEGTKVGAACNEWTGSENLKLSIENAGLKHLNMFLGCGQDEGGLKKMIIEVSMIVCSVLVEKKIRAMAPRDKEIIVDHRRLDKAGIEML